MMLPSIFDRDFRNSFFDDLLRISFPTREWTGVNQMHSDIRELADAYQIEMELPGFDKEDIQAELKDGYLIVEAKRSENKDEKDEQGKYVRRERYTGSYQRSFYVGEQMSIQDIKANFKNGVLTMMVPKKEALPKAEEKKYISIQE